MSSTADARPFARRSSRDRVPRLLRPLYRLLARGSEQCGLHGLDVFHFDEHGMICGKNSSLDALFLRLDREHGEPL